MRLSSRGLPYLVPAALMVLFLPRVPDGWAVGFGASVVVASLVALVRSLVARGTTLSHVALDPLSVLAGFIFIWHFSFFLVLMAGLASGFRVEAYLEMAPDENNRALALCGVGLLAFLGGGDTAGKVRWSHLATVTRPAVAWYGALIAYGGAALVLVYFLGPGRRLVGNYDLIFLESDPLRRLYNLGVLFTISGTAIHLSAKSLRPRHLASAIPPVLAVALVSGAIGSRWVTISLALAIAMAASIRGWKPRTLPFVGLVLVLAIGSVALKGVRRVGVVGPQPTLLGQLNPIVESLEEVGQAFRSTVGTVERYGPGRLQYEWGETLVPAALSVVPSLPERVMEVRRPNEELAATFFYQEFRGRGYTLGFSLIAELYMNFGPWGVLLGMGVLGFCVAEATLRAHEGGSTVWTAAVIISVLVLWFGMRNDVFTWFRNWTWGMGIVLIVHTMDFRFPRRWSRT